MVSGQFSERSRAQTRKSHQKLAVRSKSTLHSLGAFIHIIYSWNNISKDHRARSRSDYLRLKCLSNVHASLEHTDGHALRRLSASPQRLELLGTRCGAPLLDSSAAVCTREPAGACQKGIRQPGRVPSDRVQRWRSGKTEGKGAIRKERKGVINQNKPSGAPERGLA